MTYAGVVLGLMSLLALYATGQPMPFAFAVAVAVTVMVSGLQQFRPKGKRAKKKKNR